MKDAVYAGCGFCLLQCATKKESITIWLRWLTTQGSTARPTGPGSCGPKLFSTVTAMGSVFWLPTSTHALCTLAAAAQRTQPASDPAAAVRQDAACSWLCCSCTTQQRLLVRRRLS